MINLKEKPFYLSNDDIDWVYSAINNMSEEEKIGQLFCLFGYSSDKKVLESIIERYKPGGIMCVPMKASEIIRTIKIVQEKSQIPLLISADLENGGSGIAIEGTNVAYPLQIAATNDEHYAFELGNICGKEAAALGCNWSFAPDVDIDYNFKNPVNNLRTFGSNPEKIKRMGINYIKGIQKNRIAACLKHFPGDGIDERNQHLISSVNNLSCLDWDNSYGDIYKACIEEGAMTLMLAPMMLPEYSRKLNENIKDEEILPAPLSFEICTLLTRNILGFNGLIVSNDSTTAGMMLQLPRSQVIPKTIEAGCDMVLFTRNMEEDFNYMELGIKNGSLSRARLNDALVRILGLKASLGLHKNQIQKRLVPDIKEAMTIIGNKEHQSIANEIANKAITLVKNNENILPINPESYKNILLYGIGNNNCSPLDKVNTTNRFKNLLEREGFNVEVFVLKPEIRGKIGSYDEVKDKYDLILYIADINGTTHMTTNRIEWEQSIGSNLPIFISTIPTIFISVGNPYLLFDCPRVKTYINAYKSSDNVLQSLVEKIMGKSKFLGTNPIDPFCGMWDTRL
ncbi:MAG: glycoside hydrolase family 3 protein [Anaerolineaceae bacterium]